MTTMKNIYISRVLLTMLVPNKGTETTKQGRLCQFLVPGSYSFCTLFNIFTISLNPSNSNLGLALYVESGIRLSSNLKFSVGARKLKNSKKLD